jgi:hypothetical protein
MDAIPPDSDVLQNVGRASASPAAGSNRGGRWRLRAGRTWTAF